MSALTCRAPAAAGSAQRTCRFAESAASTTAREHLAAAMGTWTMLLGQLCPAQPTRTAQGRFTSRFHGA